ncbi:MAG: M14 family metallopeptidase [Bacteriovoracia bacterium]
MKRPSYTGMWVAILLSASVPFGLGAQTETRFIQVKAKDKFERSAVANTGMTIEFVRSDSVWGFAAPEALKELQRRGHQILGNFSAEVGRSGHEGTLDFPNADARYHNYAELAAEMKRIHMSATDITRFQSIGQTPEGREMFAMNINTNPEDLASGKSSKPGIVYMGAHHAREHLSVEIPLMFLDYLIKNREDSAIKTLLDNRDIWIIPMINPDGAEYDIATGTYKVWRKNRTKNGNGTYGVDLNRNYGYGWGTGGSSRNPNDETYMGTAPFSEKETQNVKAFVDARPNLKVLLSFHTFSELILYPWGGTHDPISNKEDLAAFQSMAKTMAAWNGYTPEQSSDLYIASGDTTDWAYATHGIFAFTFELSPKSAFGSAGFYPGAKVIDKVFNDNIKPCMYLLDITDNPHKTLDHRPSGFLKYLIEPGISYADYFQTSLF